MPKRLTQPQVEQYHNDGFVCPVDVMSREQAFGYRQRLETAEATYPEMLNPTNRNNAHIAFTFLDEIIHHPAVLDAVEDIIGPDILCWGTVLFIKEPESEAYVSWHQDLTYTPIRPHDGVSIWLALSPSNRETGCMRMLPGTHRDGIRAHRDTFGEHNVLTRGQNIDAIDPDNADDLVLEPGQMSLHHGRTIHGSAPNLGNERRIGVVVQQFIPPHVRETHGAGYALTVRGTDNHGHFRPWPRPTEDMSPEAAAARAEINEHWANFLYAGAEQTRAY